jgi:hypothetical protein
MIRITQIIRVNSHHSWNSRFILFTQFNPLNLLSDSIHRNHYHTAWRTIKSDE